MVGNPVLQLQLDLLSFEWRNLRNSVLLKIPSPSQCGYPTVFCFRPAAPLKIQCATSGRPRPRLWQLPKLQVHRSFGCKVDIHSHPRPGIRALTRAVRIGICRGWTWRITRWVHGICTNRNHTPKKMFSSF